MASSSSKPSACPAEAVELPCGSPAGAPAACQGKLGSHCALSPLSSGAGAAGSIPCVNPTGACSNSLARLLWGSQCALVPPGVPERLNRPLLPAVLVLETPTEAIVTIVEGRYHQVRRMMAALGSRVVALHRESIGKLILPHDLPPGGFRELGLDEIAATLETVADIAAT